MTKGLMVLFPGIGYTCDKPLLYYAAKLGRAAGYEVVTVPYGNFPPKVKGDQKKMKDSFDIALEQSRQMLGAVPWEGYGDIVFVGKSVGTIVAMAYAKEKGLSVRGILLTPLKETFQFASENCIALHGTSDPWAEDGEIEEGCRKAGIPLHLFENANHSLETGDVDTDLTYLKRAVAISRAFLQKDTP